MTSLDTDASRNASLTKTEGVMTIWGHDEEENSQWGDGGGLQRFGVK